MTSPASEAQFVSELLDDLTRPGLSPEAKNSALRTLFVEGLDFGFRDGTVPLPQDEFSGPAVLLAEHSNVTVVAVRTVASGRVSAGDVRAALKTLRASVVGDLLVAATTAKEDEWHLVYPAQSHGRDILRRMVIRPGEPRRTIVEQVAGIYRDLVATGDARGALERAFDVEAVTERFFAHYRRVFQVVEAALEGFSPAEADHRRLFCQTLFNRLMFLYFLQRKGLLKYEGSTEYLESLWRSSRRGGDRNFYRDRLEPLFFEALNTVGGSRSRPDLVESVGDVPYLNGGLFARDELDERSGTVIPDSAIAEILGGLFARFNFTVTESTPYDVEVAVDPEMLGKVFEELVTGRQQTGSYYTPRAVVSFMCREALKAYLGDGDAVMRLVDDDDAGSVSIAEARELLTRLDAIRAVDPACGSGAYLLGLLQELVRLHKRLDTRLSGDARTEYELKVRIIEAALYGVDIDRFAVNIARLRLWLSLMVEFAGAEDPPPLPNLDFKIEVGDSLTGPSLRDRPQLAVVQELVRQYGDLKRRYVTADPSERGELATAIGKAQEQIRDWSHGGPRSDGFDWALEFAEVFSRPEAPGFDIVLANPPYGASIAPDVAGRYFDRVTERGQSSDTYALFIARGLELTQPKGVLSYIVSDTWRTLQSHLPLRTRLRSDTTVRHVLDLPAWIFRATVTTTIVTLQRGNAPEGHRLVAGDLRAIPAGRWDQLSGNLLTIARGGVDAQSLEYARYTYEQADVSRVPTSPFFIAEPSLFEHLDGRHPRLDSLAEVRVGLQTGDNAYYIRKRPEARGAYPPIDDALVLRHEELTRLTEAEKVGGLDPSTYDGRTFVPYDKGGESDASGGWLPNYWVPTDYFINWSRDAVAQLRSRTVADVRRQRGLPISPGDSQTRAAVIRNERYYFVPGITFSDSGVYAPTFRQSAGSVFDQKGSIIVPREGVERDALLGVLCSKLARYFLKTFINHTVSAHVDSIKAIPIASDALESQELRQITAEIVARQRADPRSDYQDLQQAADRAVYAAYSLRSEQIREIELWYCRRYPRLADRQGEVGRMRATYGPYLSWADRQLNEVTAQGDDPIVALLRSGESATLEFKSSARWDYQLGRLNRELEGPVLKTVAAFLNSDGGKLLLGVSDPGAVLGLEADYATLRSKPNRDGYSLYLANLIFSNLGLDLAPKVDIRFYVAEGRDICLVEVAPSARPVFLRDGQDDRLFVRATNSSRALSLVEAIQYARERFPTETAVGSN